MNFQGVDLNLLVALEALLAEKSVTRAAKRLRISQPGMSAALQKLREYYADPLLELVDQKFVLTPKAEALQAPLAEVLGRIRKLAFTEKAARQSRAKAARKKTRRPTRYR